MNIQSVYPEHDTDQAAAERHRDFHNGMFLDPLFKGHYPDGVLQALNQQMPTILDADLETIQQPLDFWGLNYYTPSHVKQNDDDKAEYPASTVVSKPNVTRTDIGWEVNASSMADLIQQLYKEYALPPCYITENGAAYNHQLVNGLIDDQPRVEYMQDHIACLIDVIEAGIDLRGYFAWSLMDNFEWAEGYTMRFGIVHVDYNSQQRTIKRSGHWYRDLCMQHQLQRNSR